MIQWIHSNFSHCSGHFGVLVVWRTSWAGFSTSTAAVKSEPLSFSVCVGDPSAALRLSSQLISLGADVSLRSRWTNMNALHYAAYFDVPELVRVLLKATKPRGTHSPLVKLITWVSGLEPPLVFVPHSVKLHMQWFLLWHSSPHCRLQPVSGCRQMSAGTRCKSLRSGKTVSFLFWEMACRHYPVEIFTVLMAVPCCYSRFSQ